MGSPATRTELLEEYYKLTAIIHAYDGYCLTIKAWGLTASGAALGIAFSKDRSIAVSLLALVCLALSASFWITEVRFKLFQLNHMLRASELEEALNSGNTIEAPRIFGAFGEQSARNILAKRWRSVLFWPQVMFPHVVFVAISSVLFLIELGLDLKVRF